MAAKSLEAIGRRLRLRHFALATCSLAAFAFADPAFAQCATTTAGDGTVTLICGTTITNSSVNRNGNNPSTISNLQSLEAPLNVTINSGATISGWGLYVSNTSTPASVTPRPLNFVNNGIVSHTVGWDQPEESAGLTIGSNSGSIRYSGNGSAITNGTANATGNFTASTGLVIYASGLNDSVTFGSQAAPITGATFRGEAGAQLVAERGRLDAWFSGGTITATREASAFGALSIQAADSINLSMTGGTVVTGGIQVSQTAGPGHSAASTVTVTTDARITGTYSAGVGLQVFSREAGADITLASGASINVANVGVLLNPNTGQSRFTTAAGTTISQTGTTGAARIGMWFNPVGTGALLADLSGSITATGTGILLSPLNGNALVTIRAGAGVNGDQTGIQVFQTAGGTGTVDIRNAGTLSGAVAVAGTPAGTAFVLTNSGTMTGAVRVTGSAVGSSLLTNSGTWNLGAGDSTFSGSVTSSGTLNMADGAINTLTVGGNLTFAAGSTLRLDIGNGTNDRVNVTGTASLNGAVAAFAAGSVFIAGTYTLLNAVGGISGTFSPLTTSPTTGASLRYDGNNVYLDINATANQTFSFSTRESLVFNTPTVTTNASSAFSTQIVGRLLGGQPLYDQTFAAAFGSATVQNGVTAARAAITTAGGPGVIIGDPVRTSSTTTTATTSASIYSLAGPGAVTTSSTTTFGPATIQIGALSTCNVASLPSATRPVCTTGGTSFTVADGTENFDTLTTTTYTINETRTDTTTTTLRETYELTGQVATVGMIHAEVQSGVLDLGGRLLGRLATTEGNNQGWAEVYRFRVSQSGRRDAWGLAGGFGVAVAPGVTLGLGVDHGNLDIDVPGADEEGDVELTEIGAVLRIDSGPFAASLALVHGFGEAETLRTIIGSSRADYDVRLTGGAVDFGYAIETGGWTIRPVAGLDYLHLSTDAFTETDTLGLIAARQGFDRVRASGGVEVSRDFGGIAIGASARYLAVLDGDERTLPVAFAAAPGRLLDMTGPSEPDTLMIGARARVPLSPNAALSLSYGGRFGSGYDGHAATAGVTITW